MRKKVWWASNTQVVDLLHEEYILCAAVIASRAVNKPLYPYSEIWNYDEAEEGKVLNKERKNCASGLYTLIVDLKRYFFRFFFSTFPSTRSCLNTIFYLLFLLILS